jgi:hypothetical protein
MRPSNKDWEWSELSLLTLRVARKFLDHCPTMSVDVSHRVVALMLGIFGINVRARIYFLKKDLDSDSEPCPAAQIV